MRPGVMVNARDVNVMQGNQQRTVQVTCFMDILLMLLITFFEDKPPESSCSVKSCDKRQMRKDKFKYVLEEIRIPGVCCSEYKKTACKKDGSIYQVW